MPSIVFVKNLSFKVDEKLLKSCFDQIGNVIYVIIIKDHIGKSKGEAFVAFEKEEYANNACQYKFNSDSLGNNIQVEKVFTEITQNCDEINNKESNKIQDIFDKMQKKLENFDQQLKLLNKRIDEINNKQEQFLHLKKDINYFKFKEHPLKYFLIPTGKVWNVDSPIKNTLNLKDLSCTVNVSSIWEDVKNHYPYFLFNGKMEKEDNSKWATSSNQSTAYILIQFNKQMLANVLFIASRNQCYNQSPNDFGIFGIDPVGNHIILKKVNNIIWKKNDKRYFMFENTTSYQSYEIVFYSCNDPNHIFGLSQLNIGYIP